MSGMTGFNLTIAIPTVVGREKLFESLRQSLADQIARDGLGKKVELIWLRDNKEISIGVKRQKLYEMAQGRFCVQIDDDDGVHPQFAITLNRVIEQQPLLTGIGYIEHCTIDGRVFLAHHSNRWADWGENGMVDGRSYPYVRPLFFKDPIRTDICRHVGVSDLRYGEDVDFARRLKASGLLKATIDLPKEMYFYRYRDEPLAAKFGLAGGEDLIPKS